MFIVHVINIEQATVEIIILRNLFYYSLLAENLVLVCVTHTYRHRIEWLVLDHGLGLDTEIQMKDETNNETMKQIYCKHSIKGIFSQSM